MPVPDPEMERNPNQPLAQDTQWKDIQKERQKNKRNKGVEWVCHIVGGLAKFYIRKKHIYILR